MITEFGDVTSQECMLLQNQSWWGEQLLGPTPSKARNQGRCIIWSPDVPITSAMSWTLWPPYLESQGSGVRLSGLEF